MDQVEDNKAIAVRVVEGFGNVDFDTLTQLLHEDMDYNVLGMGKLRRKDIFDALGGLSADAESMAIEPRTVIAEGDRVIIQADGNMQFKNGVSYRNSYCFVFRLADGKVVEGHEYLDTALIERLFGPDALSAVGS